jgi:hypothetical protein
MKLAVFKDDRHGTAASTAMKVHLPHNGLDVAHPHDRASHTSELACATKGLSRGWQG